MGISRIIWYGTLAQNDTWTLHGIIDSTGAQKMGVVGPSGTVGSQGPQGNTGPTGTANPHILLDGYFNSDTEAYTPTTGDIIYSYTGVWNGLPGYSSSGYGILYEQNGGNPNWYPLPDLIQVSMMPNSGDLLVNISGTIQRLSIGTPGQILTVITGASGPPVPTWGNQLSVPNAPSNTSANGLIVQFKAAQGQNFGDACYINVSGSANLAKADVIANAWAMAMVIDATIASGSYGNYLLLGIARDDTKIPLVANGSPMYLSTSGSTQATMVSAQPAGANNVIQILGIMIAPHTIFFSPQLVQVEHV